MSYNLVRGGGVELVFSINLKSFFKIGIYGLDVLDLHINLLYDSKMFFPFKKSACTQL